MKNTKNILMAALAAISIGSASAETIYITGSTAFRGAANKSIQDYVTANAGSLIAKDNATLASAGNLVWRLGSDKIVAYWSGSEAGIQSLAGPQTIGYKAAFNQVTTNTQTGITNSFVGGGGITRVPATGAATASTVWTQRLTNSITNAIASQPNLLPFWDGDQTFTTASGTGETLLTGGTPTKVNAVATIAFSDTYQSTSAFGNGRTVAYYNTNNLGTNSNGLVTLAAASVICASNSYSAITNDIPVGAVSYAFICSANAAAKNASSFVGTSGAIANITKAQAKDLLVKGKVNLAQYTGSLGDTNRFAYAVGRSIDSGTRLLTFSLVGLGSTITPVGINTGVNQYLVIGTNSGVSAANARTGSSGSVFVRANGTSITNSGSLDFVKFPAEIVVGKMCAEGHDGYASGGNLCTTVAAINATNSPNAVAIGYAGLSDIVSKSANIIAYEGVYPSTGGVISGSYPFWSIEHLLVNNAASATAQTIATGVANNIKAQTTAGLVTYGKGLVSLSDLTNGVSRTVDGGTITKSWTNSVGALTNLPSYYTSSKAANAGAGQGF